eukprot:GHVU01206968.1.p1 GENE.GHVU01206968.1~~GHVU01206968.1.p1  ORF type:complete len:410 (+),score=87.18 GHVU01206968.1:384-1613(+)
MKHMTRRWEKEQQEEEEDGNVSLEGGGNITGLEMLPLELLVRICSLLDSDDIGRCMACARLFAVALRHEAIWEPNALRDFGRVVVDEFMRVDPSSSSNYNYYSAGSQTSSSNEHMLSFDTSSTYKSRHETDNNARGVKPNPIRQHGPSVDIGDPTGRRSSPCTRSRSASPSPAGDHPATEDSNRTPRKSCCPRDNDNTGAPATAIAGGGGGGGTAVAAAAAAGAPPRAVPGLPSYCDDDWISRYHRIAKSPYASLIRTQHKAVQLVRAVLELRVLAPELEWNDFVSLSLPPKSSSHPNQHRWGEGRGRGGGGGGGGGGEPSTMHDYEGATRQYKNTNGHYQQHYSSKDRRGCVGRQRCQRDAPQQPQQQQLLHTPQVMIATTTPVATSAASTAAVSAAAAAAAALPRRA